jgi:transposase
MGKVIRVQPHLTVEEIDERLKHLRDFWRIRRWMIIPQVLVDPAPAKAIALRFGVSLFTVCDLSEAYNRRGPEPLETPGKGQRQNAYLSVEEEQRGYRPF